MKEKKIRSKGFIAICMSIILLLVTGLGTLVACACLGKNGDESKDGSNSNEGGQTPQPPVVWSGEIDVSWYFENIEAQEYSLSSAEQLAGFASLVNGSAIMPASEEETTPITFEGKTITLEKDIDLGLKDENGNPISFEPIGNKTAFSGIFDGNGHTINNLYQSGWAFGYEWGKYGSIGLFGEIEDATIKNVIINGYEAQIEGGDIGGITGSATGTCVFENIQIKNSKFGTYNNGIGGIIGWSGEGNYTFKNIHIAEDVIFGGLWGSFDSSVGGIVGQAEPAPSTYSFENVYIACRLDVFNDCTASYDYYNYRMCGMIMGRLAQTTTIENSNYPDLSKYDITCNNVTVVYSDWANYSYCRADGERAKRVEDGFAYTGIAEDYDHSRCNLHCKEVIAFDQIFGGAQFGVKGIKSYQGVNVIYNNK